MSHVAVEASGLSKSYRIPHLQRSAKLPASPQSWIDRFKSRRDRYTETVWVLDDVSFKITQGEIVGVIGRNGSGKSTLLKILSRVTRPTRGSAVIRGRVGALLEVGTGFHPDLTGHENVYLNGALLGMSHAEVRRKFDEIVAFAEVERFLDLPVKFYSSGMYARLAFAVAAHLDPDVLIVDEVLAVGDSEFQQKCLGKMGDMTRAGRTVFFVSHNMATVSALCTRCLLLRGGRIIHDGDPESVIQHYVEIGEATTGGEVVLTRPVDQPPAYVTRAALRNEVGDISTQIEMGSHATLEVEYTLETQVRDTSFEILVTRNGVPVFDSFDTDRDESVRARRDAGRYRASVRLPLERFKEGAYSIELPIQSNRQKLFDPHAVIGFEIVNHHRDLTHRSYRADRPGQFAIDLEWDIERLS